MLWIDVSMPFIGLSPFLPIRSQGLYTIAICVNALYRAFSISTETIKSVLDTNASCQCPLSGFLHFYIHEVGEYSPVKPCVNALYRAFSISTLPSGNALKWSICRLDFAGNWPSWKRGMLLEQRFKKTPFIFCCFCVSLHFVHIL